MPECPTLTRVQYSVGIDHCFPFHVNGFIQITVNLNYVPVSPKRCARSLPVRRQLGHRPTILGIAAMTIFTATGHDLARGYPPVARLWRSSTSA